MQNHKAYLYTQNSYKPTVHKVQSQRGVTIKNSIHGTETNFKIIPVLSLLFWTPWLYRPCNIYFLIPLSPFPHHLYAKTTPASLMLTAPEKCLQASLPVVLLCSPCAFESSLLRSKESTRQGLLRRKRGGSSQQSQAESSLAGKGKARKCSGVVFIPLCTEREQSPPRGRHFSHK